MRSTAILLGLLALSCPAFAQSTLKAWQIPGSKQADESAVAFRNLKVSGRDLQRAVGKVRIICKRSEPGKIDARPSAPLGPPRIADAQASSFCFSTPASSVIVG